MLFEVAGAAVFRALVPDPKEERSPGAAGAAAHRQAI